MKPYVYYIFTYRLLLCAHRIRDFFLSSLRCLSLFQFKCFSLARTHHLFHFLFFEILATIFFRFPFGVCVVDIFSVVALESLFLSSTCCLAFSLGRKFNDTKWEKRKWDRFEYVDGHVFVFFSRLFPLHILSLLAVRMYLCVYIYKCICIYVFSACIFI